MRPTGEQVDILIQFIDWLYDEPDAEPLPDQTVSDMLNKFFKEGLKCEAS